MQVIPAIDIYEGKCVRLQQGDFSSRKEYADPREVAEHFATAGAGLLHVVDLEGARKGRIVNWESLERIVSVQDIAVQFGGGIRTEEDVSSIMQMGVKRIIVGSIAVRAPQVFAEWIAKFGADRFCAAMDIKDGSIVTNGWQTKDPIDLEKAISGLAAAGARVFLCTDVSRDGTLRGPNIPLYRELAQKFPSKEWLASGGISRKQDLIQLQGTGIAGAIIGMAFYEGVLKLEDLGEFLC